MTNREILMLWPLPDAQMVQLKEKYILHCLWQVSDPEARLVEVRERVTGVVSSVWNGLSAKVIRALPNLEIIAHYGVGTDNVDLQAARELGVVVTNTPDVLTDDTADFAMGLLLAVNRRMVEGDIYVRSGLWSKKGDLPLGRSLRSKKMGIVGLGRIGKAIAKRAEAFGIAVSYSGPNKKKDVKYPYFKSVPDMAETVDFLVIACPGGEKTRNLIDAKALKALGRDGILINIARGSVVNESDLVDALQGGIIAGAGLDVFANEPNVPTAFLSMDNVVLQPHQGSATVETRAAMAQLVVDNLSGYFENAKVLTPVGA